MAYDCEYASMSVEDIIEWFGAVFLLVVAVSTAFNLGYVLLRIVMWIL